MHREARARGGSVAGVVRRRVVDDLAVMRRLADGGADQRDREDLERRGQFLHAGGPVGADAAVDPRGRRRG